MLLPALLHCHTSADPHDTYIRYSPKDLIDLAAKRGFKVISMTHHYKVILKKETITYAKKRGIIVIPGTEIEIDGKKHTLVINAHRSVEKIKTYQDLKNYRKSHPESLVIAPHPYFPTKECHRENTEKHIELFDALELSWFHWNFLNFNKRTVTTAKKHKKPLVATPDLHFIRFFGTSYCVINSGSKKVNDIITAIKRGRVTNINRPTTFPKFIMTLLWIAYSKLYFDKNKHHTIRK